MKNRLNIMIAAALLLLIINILNWSGVFAGKAKRDAVLKTVGSLDINWQQPGNVSDAKVSKNVFYSSDNNDYGAAGAYEYGSRPAGDKGKAVAVPTPEKVWPLFKVSGVAVNNGKECAFFSGPVFSGAVYEGNDINDNYAVSSITGNKIEITDKLTGLKKIYTMEAK